MVCSNCGEKDDKDSLFCMKCGQPLKADSGTEAAKSDPAAAAQGAAANGGAHPVWRVAPKRRRGMAISISISVILLAVIIFILALSANPVAGRWYAQDGTELVLLKNGKGMTVTDGDMERIHFMYAVGYREAGYIEGQIYIDAGGDPQWFYVYDGKLEFAGEFYYRNKPSGILD